MESFMLSETARYLYLLAANATGLPSFFVLSTEGHMLPPLPAKPGINVNSSKFIGGRHCISEGETNTDAGFTCIAYSSAGKGADMHGCTKNAVSFNLSHGNQGHYWCCPCPISQLMFQRSNGNGTRKFCLRHLSPPCARCRRQIEFDGGFPVGQLPETVHSGIRS